MPANRPARTFILEDCSRQLSASVIQFLNASPATLLGRWYFWPNSCPGSVTANFPLSLSHQPKHVSESIRPDVPVKRSGLEAKNRPICSGSSSVPAHSPIHVPPASRPRNSQGLSHTRNRQHMYVSAAAQTGHIPRSTGKRRGRLLMNDCYCTRKRARGDSNQNKKVRISLFNSSSFVWRLQFLWHQAVSESRLATK
jgi:hypothetical protein